MSLILDALRRADSERDRGAVPGLHAQPAPIASPEASARGSPRPWAWIIAAVGVGLLAALAWILVGREPPRQAAAPVPAPSPVAAAPAVAGPITTSPAAEVRTAPSGPVPPPAAITSREPNPVTALAPRENVLEPQPVAEPAPWPTPESGHRPPTAVTPAAPAAGVAEARPAQQPISAAAADAPITTRERLPEGIRSQLPPLLVGGSIYSASAPDRSLIIDGRLLRENDRLSGDLTLEQIRPRSAVLRFKGYRFEIAF